MIIEEKRLFVNIVIMENTKMQKEPSPAHKKPEGNFLCPSGLKLL